MKIGSFIAKNWKFIGGALAMSVGAWFISYGAYDLGIEAYQEALRDTAKRIPDCTLGNLIDHIDGMK